MFADDAGRVHKVVLFGEGEGEIDYSFHTVSAEDTGQGKSDIIETVSPVEGRREGNDLFFVVLNYINNMRNGGSNAVIRGSLTTNDFVCILATFCLSPGDVFLSKLRKVGERFATDSGGRDGGKGGITMFAEDIGVNAGWIDVN